MWPDLARVVKLLERLVAAVEQIAAEMTKDEPTLPMINRDVSALVERPKPLVHTIGGVREIS